MKKRQHKAQEKKGIGSDLARWCMGAVAAANAACAGTQVRPVPVPEACPPGSFEVMYRRLDIGGISPSLFVPGFDPYEHARKGGRKEPIPVQEGPATIYFGGEWGKLPSGSYFSGRLIIGPERVYGRFTELRLPSGERLPVCLALVRGFGGEQGLPIEGSDAQGNVMVFPIARFETVESFE